MLSKAMREDLAVRDHYGFQLLSDGRAVSFKCEACDGLVLLIKPQQRARWQWHHGTFRVIGGKHHACLPQRVDDVLARTHGRAERHRFKEIFSLLSVAASARDAANAELKVLVAMSELLEQTA